MALEHQGARDPHREADRLRATLAARAARQNELLRHRAERLARIRTCAGGPVALLTPDVPAAEPAEPPKSAVRDAEALERLLAALIGPPEPAPAALRPAAAVVPLARQEPAAPAGDAAGLATLPGAGPGLVAALIRAGVPDLAALAALGPERLAARLGPLARLIDLRTWTAHARAAASGWNPTLGA